MRLRQMGITRAAALGAALVAGAIGVSLSSGSSHREAPGTMIDPTADDTDVYAFTAKGLRRAARRPVL